MCDDIETCLKDLKSNSRTAIAISRKRVINSGDYSGEEIYCFNQEENIKRIPISFLMRSHYELLSKINRYLRILMESGLLAKWEKDNIVRGGNHFSYDILTLNHFIGPFGVCLAGLTLSFTIFLVEIAVKIAHSKCERKKYRKMVLLIENLITSERMK